MEIHLKIIGIISILLAGVHVVFPRRFDWKKEMESVSLMNKQLMYVHTFFIAFVVLLMGILCFTNSAELINTPLGKQVSLGLLIFWGIRLVFQFFVYSPRLWKGKPFETAMHVLFSAIWIYFTVVFWMIYFA